MLKLVLATGVAAAALAASVPAQAATITYTATGQGEGRLNGFALCCNFTLTGVGDTDTALIDFLPGVNVIPLSTVKLSFFGAPDIFGVDGTAFFTVAGTNFSGFNYFGTSGLEGLLAFGLPSQYQGLTDFGPVMPAFGTSQFTTYQTNLGTFQWASQLQVTSFQAVVSAAGGVPEPATWAMMLLGIGGIGATLRQRKRHSAKVAYS